MRASRFGVALAMAGVALCMVALVAGEPVAVLPGLAAVAVGLVLRRT